MLLYLMRHGEAEPAGERPLSAAGRQQVEKVAGAAARAGARPVHLFHSGKLRAQQTAEIAARVLGVSGVPRKTSGLDPNDHPNVARELVESLAEDALLAGHLPHMELLAALLVSGDAGRPLLVFPCAGMACLERDAVNKRWLIRWMLTPETA